MKNQLKTLLQVGLLLPAIIFGGRKATAEELKQKPTIERILNEEKDPKSKVEVELGFNYEIESEQKDVDYLTARTGFNREWELFWCSPNIFELTPVEENQIENIIRAIKNGEIDSYQELVQRASPLSENQKPILYSVIGSILHDYNTTSEKTEIISQDVFFDYLQNSLETGRENYLGSCKYVHSHEEQLINDSGTEAAAVTGATTEGRHVYVILNAKEGRAIIDYNDILMIKTKNIEKALEIYQKHQGVTIFYHKLFKNNQLKYIFPTEDGERFFKFVEYDKSLKSLEDLLTENIKPSRRLTISANHENYLDSIKFGYKGFLIKAGEIRGDSSSPMNDLDLLQIGFERNFLTSETKSLNFLIGNKIIGLGGNFIYGNLYQDSKLDDNRVLGINYHLIASTNNEKGFNFNVKGENMGVYLGDNSGGFNPKIGPGLDLTLSKNYLYGESMLGAGVSYKICIREFGIKPYVILQNTFLREELIGYKRKLKPSELNTGIVFDLQTSKNTNITIDPSYIRRIWEEEFGANANFGIRNLRMNIGGYVIKSNYEFCPDKRGYNIGVFGKHKNLEVKLNYEDEQTNYDDEIENQRSLKIKASIKF